MVKVRPVDILIGDMIEVGGKVVLVKEIAEYWDGRYSFLVTCPEGNYNYPYKCNEADRITLPRGIG